MSQSFTASLVGRHGRICIPIDLIWYSLPVRSCINASIMSCLLFGIVYYKMHYRSTRAQAVLNLDTDNNRRLDILSELSIFCQSFL